MTKFEIDRSLVVRIMDDLSRYGSDGGTGITRTVYSPAWVEATDAYARWVEDAGFAARRDAVGNVWARLEGATDGPCVVSGSHIDSQTPGGRFDGTLGAVAALVAIRTLKEQAGTPRVPVEAVALCEEESSRFPAAGLWGSRAITGRIAEDDLVSVRDFDDIAIGDAMRAVGLDPARILEARRDDIDAFVELHIEQGPILEQAGFPVAIVKAITGIRHYQVVLEGTQNHAGAFPMDLRRDPMAGFAEIASGLIDTAHRWGRPAVSTVGRVAVSPNGTAVIPERVTFTVDARHPDPDSFHRLCRTHEAHMLEVAARRDLAIRWRTLIQFEPSPSDPAIVEALTTAAAIQGVPHLVMASGAAHDTQQMAQIARTAMVFVRSKDGRSHTPEEYSSLDDIVAGIEVLTAGLHRLAYRGESA
ncbi:allantoate deiminase [Amaricoccus macauensis]|uniref:Allantoate deiminase n=1 Tax=Amaricoccus macauensis TaxID=57001 RepID=A0A840SYR9_9RHOB|nr:allantoate deiminase [Amaricoccus macauensis]